MTRTTLTVILGALCAATIGGAARADSEWASRSELGYALARGNTDSDNGNLKFGIAHLYNHWIEAFGVDGLYGKTNGIGTAQRLDGHLQVDYKFTDSAFWFGKLEYQDDRYSGFQYQASAATGLGRIFLQSDTDKLTAQLGIGVRRLRPEQVIRDDTGAVLDRIPGESSEDTVAAGAVTCEHDFNTSTKLLESLSVESGRANTLVKNNLGIQVKMSTSLALAISYSYIRNSSPPPTTVLSKTDQLTTVNLVYEIKNDKVPAMPVALLDHQLNSAN